MYLKQRNAFTMIELVFVIVVIGILSAVAIPKFAVTRDDAVIARGKNVVASLRSSLATLRQKNILKGDFDDVNATALKATMEYGLGSDWAVAPNATPPTFTFTCPLGGTCVFNLSNNKLSKGTCAADCDMSDL